MIIINDTTSSDIIKPKDKGRGLNLSLRTDEGYGTAADPFPAALLIPRSEWEPRIKELEKTKTRLSDLCKFAGLPAKNQGSLPYCWIFAPTYCLEVIRVFQNQPMEQLSATAAGAQIKNYRKVGGWGKEALEWLSTKGTVPVSRWPELAVDKRYETLENKALDLSYRVSEWWEAQPRNLDQVISLLLHRIPVAVGYNWWRHEVTAVDAVWLDGEVAIKIRNQWLGWGDDNYGILQGKRMLPDDAVAPRSAVAC
jgi:hypothetical protein